MNAVIPNDAVTEPQFRYDDKGRLVIEIPNARFSSCPIGRSFDVRATDLLDLVKQAFMLGELHARQCALVDAERAEERASITFDSFDTEAF